MAGSTELAALGIQFVAEGGDETLNAFLKITGAAETLIQKLNIQNATFNYSKEAMVGFAAAQLGVTNQTQALIRSLTELTVAQEQSRIQQTRDLELYKMRGEAAKKLEADITAEADAYFAAMNAEVLASEKAAASVISLNAQRNRAMAENRAAAIASINEQAEAVIAAQAAEEARLTAFNAFKTRTLAENRMAAIATLEEQEQTAAKIAEQQAIAEIKWATLSYEVRIKQLKDLQAYQMSSSISPATVSKQFAGVPNVVQGNAAATEIEYTLALRAQQEASRLAANEARNLAHGVQEAGINVNRATSEVIVLGREFSRGNFSKMGGSATVLAQALGGLTSPLTLIGGALTFVGYEALVGTLQFEKMKESLAMTGDYAGVTADGLNALAQSASHAGGTVGVAKEAVTQLAASGKFTSESILTIATAATQMEEVTGQSVAATIKQFESLAVQSTGRNTQATEAITKAAIKLDDTYHFLTLSVYDHIVALEKEGRMKEASAVATDALAETVGRRSKELAAHAGTVLKAWREVKEMFSQMTDAIGSWGRTGPQAEVDALTKSYNLMNDSLMSGHGTEAAMIATREKMTEIAKKLATAQGLVADANKTADERGKDSLATSEAIHAKFAIEQMNMTLQKKSLGELNYALGEYALQRDKIAAKNANDPLLDPAEVERTIAAITKAHTPKEAGPVASNPLDNSITQMKVKIAGYRAEAQAAAEAASTEVTGLAHVNEAQVAARVAAGEFATLKKGWSADEQAAKIAELEGLAKKADAQKFVLDGTKALSAAQEKLTKDVAALNGKLADQESGSERIPKTYEDAATALLKFWGRSKESAEGQKLITDSQIKDLDTLQAATQTKMIADAKSYQLAGQDAMAAGHALGTYGSAGKATAIDIANVTIAQAQLTSKLSAGVVESLKSGAAMKQLGTAFKDIQTMYQHSLAIETAAAEASRVHVLGSEQAKVVAITQAEQKKLRLYKSDADAAIASARTSAKGSTKQQEDAYTEFLAIYDKQEALAKKTQDLDFNIAGLKDMSTIFGEMGTAANALSEGLSNVGLALNGIGAAFSSLAKIEKEEQVTGQTMTAERLGSYGAMAGAASNFFDKNSKGYHTLQSVSQAFHAGEMVMEAAKLTMKVQTAIEGMAADDASMMNSIANSVLEGEADAAAAIAKCYAQLGPVAGSIAAVAVVGALVAAGVHVMGGGGSSIPDPNSAAQMQKVQGTGTVLGDSTKQSDSINLSLSTMTTNSNAMLPLTSQMATSLKNMASGIEGVATLISGNSQAIANGLNLGITTGKSATGISGALFGSTSTTIANAGLQFGGQTVGGLQNGANVNQFATVNKDTKGAFGGIFGGGSTTSSDQTSGVDASVSQQFSLIFKNLQTSLATAAGGLGMNADEVAKAVSNAQVPLTKISLMGMNGTQQIAAISAVLSAGMDTIAAKVIPSMSAYAQMGEGAFQTTMRVASGIESANASMKLFGLTAINYTQIINKQGDIELEIGRQTMVATQLLSGGVLTGIGNIIQTFQGSAADLNTLWSTLKATQLAMKNVGLNGGDLSQSMINGAGGQANLTKGLSDYLTKYFTPGEQSAAELSNLADQFTALGQVMPTSNAGFRALVESVKTATPAGQALQGGLINLSGAFDTAMKNANALTTATSANTLAAQKALDLQLLQAQGNTAAYTAATRENALSGLTGNLLATQRAIFAAQDVTTATTNLTTAYNTQIATANTAVTKFKQLSDSIKAFADGMGSSELSNLSPEDKYNQSSARFEQTSALAATGDATALGNMQAVSQQFLTDSKAYNASTKAYSDDYNKVKIALGKASTAADQQVSAAQTQITLLTAQVSSLITINTSVLTVAEAIKALNIAKAVAAQPGNMSPTDSITNAYMTALGRAPEAAGMKYWQDSLSNGNSITNIVSAISNSAEAKSYKSVPGFASGGFHSGGLRLVGERQPEIEATGPSRIFTPAQFGQMLGGNNAEQTAEMKAQTAELKALVVVSKTAALQTIALQSQANAALQNINKQSRKSAAMPKARA